MALFSWDNRLKTNIAVCDEQHQKLISIINELHDAMVIRKDKGLIGKTIDELVVYSLYHFKTEENLLEEHGFPHLNSHRAEHLEWTKEVYGLKERYDRGEDIRSFEIISFLKDWVYDHILISDKKYSQFLRNKGVL